MTWRFIGNERDVAALQRALAGEAPPHAWLFVGPERVGKATLARRLAQALNCEASVEPCGECAPCRRIDAGIHSDVKTVTLEASDDGPQRKAISVEQIRDVERAVALNPFEGRTRVVIIDPADEMTDAAQNAFLKTLEEPPPHTVFVLIATSEERLLPTVRSRCRRLGLRLTPIEEIEKALVDDGVDVKRARLLARLSGGRTGWGLAAAGDPAMLENRREALQQARSLAAMSLAQRFDLAERLVQQFRRERESVLDRLAEWQGWQRDLLLVQAGAEDGVANVDMLAELREDAGRCERADPVGFVHALGVCREQLEANVQPRIALDALMAVAPRALETIET